MRRFSIKGEKLWVRPWSAFHSSAYYSPERKLLRLEFWISLIFFFKFELLNSGCGLSTSAAYLQVSTVFSFLIKSYFSDLVNSPLGLQAQTEKRNLHRLRCSLFLSTLLLSFPHQPEWHTWKPVHQFLVRCLYVNLARIDYCFYLSRCRRLHS